MRDDLRLARVFAEKLISDRLRDVNQALIAPSILFIIKYVWF